MLDKNPTHWGYRYARDSERAVGAWVCASVGLSVATPDAGLGPGVDSDDETAWSTRAPRCSRGAEVNEDIAGGFGGKALAITQSSATDTVLPHERQLHHHAIDSFHSGVATEFRTRYRAFLNHDSLGGMRSNREHETVHLI